MKSIESSEVLHRSFTPSYLSIELMKRDMIESVDKLMPLGADRYICMYPLHKAIIFTGRMTYI